MHESNSKWLSRHRWMALPVILTVLLTTLAACTSGGSGDDTADRVVLVSFDGLGGRLLMKWLDEEVLDEPGGLGDLADTGHHVKDLEMVNPTLTAVNHVSLITGEAPTRTGVVSNRFRTPGTRLSHSVNGFQAPIQRATLWQIARRQGRRVGILLWPGSDTTATSRMGDFGVTWPVKPLLGSEMIEFDPEQATTTMELPPNDGRSALMWPLTIDLPGAPEGVGEYLVAVLDSAPDGVPRFDQVAIRRQDELSWAYHDVREWFDLRIEGTARGDLRPHPYGAWIKSLNLDRNSGTLRLYRGAFWRLHAYPSDFAAAMFQAIGPWPGPPDGRAIGHWWLDASQGIDLDTYLEQAERLDRYIDKMAAFAFENMKFDLLISYHPIIDEYLHANHIVDPDQWAFSPGKRIAAREGLKRAAHSVDRSVAHLSGLVDRSRDALVLVSDHGLAPLNTRIRVNRVLEASGLVHVERPGERPRIADDSPMIAVTAAACSHIYLNLEGREVGGLISRNEAPELLRRAARALEGVEVNGRRAVERVVDRREAGALGIGHENCGDLVVFMNPGFTCSSSLGDDISVPSRSYAQHGYLNHHPEMHGFMLATGVGVKPGRSDRMSALEVAPNVARLMGISFP